MTPGEIASDLYQALLETFFSKCLLELVLLVFFIMFWPIHKGKYVPWAPQTFLNSWDQFSDSQCPLWSAKNYRFVSKWIQNGFKMLPIAHTTFPDYKKVFINLKDWTIFIGSSLKTVIYTVFQYGPLSWGDTCALRAVTWK